MKELSNNLNISDIKMQMCDDNQERHILDSPNKIIRWINYKFQEQIKKHKKQRENGLPLYRCIDLSNCIINTSYNNGEPSLTNLCDIIYENENVKLLDCFINNGYGNKYYHEVLEKFVCKNSLIYAAFFHMTKFHKDVDFEGTKFKGHASFGRCLFQNGAWFQKAKFSGNFAFEGCTFEGSTYFPNAEFDVRQINFTDSIFRGVFIARNLTIIDDQTNDNHAFKSYITFAGAEFHKEFDFSNNNIARDISFGGTKFYEKCNFEKCNFRNNAIFDETEINGNLLFSLILDDNERKEINWNTINNISFNRANIFGRIDFEKCRIAKLNMNFTVIKAGGIFRIYESHVTYLDLTSLNNNGVLMLEDNQNNLEEITLKSAINTGVIEIERTVIQKINDRISARLLKDSALKNGNTIDALEYRKAEMKLYKNDENLQEKRGSTFLLWLNEKSNEHGTNWIRGVKFTFICWIGFYLLFLIISRIDDIIAFQTHRDIAWIFLKDVSNGVSYLWSLDFSGTLSRWINEFVLSGVWWLIILKIIQLALGIIVYCLGKIAIAYGIYQTIVAFRKYGK